VGGYGGGGFGVLGLGSRVFGRILWKNEGSQDDYFA